jgi:hypothetical protein
MFNSKIDDAGFIENRYDYGYLLVHSMGSDVFVFDLYFKPCYMYYFTV